MEDSAVSRLLSKARRRHLAHLVLDQSTLALAIALAGAIVLLLAGTDILNWYWIALVSLASLGVGLYRLAKRVPSAYRLAQRIDRRLHLADALSTATYFADPNAPGDEAIRERQRQEAESVARSVDLRYSLPFNRPRFAWPVLALAAAAVGLFALRYAATGSLNLQPSLVKIAFDNFFTPNPALAKNNKPRDSAKPPLDPNAPDSPTTENEQPPDSTVDTPDSPDATNPQAADNAKDAAKDTPRSDPANDPSGQNADKGDKSQNGNQADQDNAPQNDSKSGNQKNAKQDSKQGNSNENSSLMDKLKDAMANMLSKMKPSQSGNQPQQQNAQKDGQSGQPQKSGQKGQQAQKQSADSDAQSDQSDTGDQKQSADAKGGEKSSDKSASQDSKSGIGSADGDKTAREAEQLQAMGKISEILGKRAQNVTGEVMVEVGSSKQQLKTPWAQRQALHTEAGSEIHRDEVPLIYQQFVEQYFEQIRKAPEAAKPARTVSK